MKNPNALAALISSQTIIATEQLGERYLNTHLGPIWGKELAAAAVTIVLYIGRHGVKAALAKIAATAKGLWSPPAPVTEPPKA